MRSKAAPAITVAISSAEQLLLDGEQHKATQLLLDAATAESIDSSMMNDIVNILLMGSLYDEALKVMRLYEAKFQQRWAGDFSFEEVAELADRSHSHINPLGDQLFKRLSLMQRGAPSHCFVLFPVRKIFISKEVVEISRYIGTRMYTWNDIEEVRITKRKTMGYGSAHSVRKICRIKTIDRTYKFDVSDVFPDFENPHGLMEALRQHAKIFVED